MQRMAESAQMADWMAKEEDFQLDQERTRAIIRIKEKRAKAIDFLALNLRYVNPINDEEDDELTKEGLEIDLDEPYNIVDVCPQPFRSLSVLLTILQSLTPQQVEELHDDIERYLRLEQTDTNIEFWTVSRDWCCWCLRWCSYGCRT